MTSPIDTHDDIPEDLDFSVGERGKFYRPGAKLNFPVYLDSQVQLSLARIAYARGIDISTLANELLKKDIE